MGSKKDFWKRTGDWIMRRFRPVFTRILIEDLAPYLKAKIDAGAIDGSVDELIDEAAREFAERL